MKYIVVSLIIAGLTACGSNGGGSSNAEDKTRQETLRKGTTAADCQGAPASQLEGRWNTLFISESFRIVMTFDFQRGGNLFLTSNCSFPAGNLNATVSGRYTSTGNTILIPYSASKTEKNAEQACSASLQKGSIQYAFEGSCLVMTDPSGDKLYLTQSY